MSNFQGIPMPECTVQLWYNKQRVKKNGTVSLYLQLIVNEEHDQVKLNSLSWPADCFNWEKKKLEERSAGDEELVKYNAIIERERAKYWNVIMNFLLQDRPFDLADIFREVNLFKTGHHFCAFMRQGIRDRLKSKEKKDMIKEATAKTHRATLTWFERYLDYKDIEILDIDSEVLKKFALYLGDHMSESALWVKIQNVKSYLSYAFRQKVAINHDHKNYNAEKIESEPVWLEEWEIRALMSLYYGGRVNGALRKILRAFMFDCFTGMRISDLSRWNTDWIKGNAIEFVPTKQRKSIKEPKVVIIPIIPIAREFIDELAAETLEMPSHQVYNKFLKKLAAIAGIKKNLTSHVGRHTFATWLAMDDVPVAVISKLLGHKSIATTMIYIHIATEYKARHMLKLQRRFGAPSPGKEAPIRV